MITSVAFAIAIACLADPARVDLSPCLPTVAEKEGLVQKDGRHTSTTDPNRRQLAVLYHDSDGIQMVHVTVWLFDSLDDAKDVAVNNARDLPQDGPLPEGGTLTEVPGQRVWSKSRTTGYTVWVLDGRIWLRASLGAIPMKRAIRHMNTQERLRLEDLVRNKLDRLTYMGYTSRPWDSVPAERKREVDVRRG